MKNELAIYASPLSANGRKVLMINALLNLDARIHEVNVYAGEGQSKAYLKINPFGKIPSVIDENITLYESNAILVYLSEAYGDNQFYSKDACLKATINSWLFWESAHWQPTVSKVIAPYVGHALLPNHCPKPEQAPNWSDPSLIPLLNHLEQILTHQYYLVGEQLTIADISIVGMMTYFRYTHFPFHKFKHLSKWYANIASLSAWKDCMPLLWQTAS